MTEQSDVLLASEAAALLRCSAGSVKKLARAGTFEGARVLLGKWVIPRAAVLAYRDGPGRKPAPVVIDRGLVNAVMQPKESA